ncbi:MAG TPA: hypothetical protein PLW17_08500 [Limnochordia bacterium]|nr:hypothetical protein [Bacillota bacterium]HOB09606.1 hypothetical protein [Limnochordia bacterium]HPZ31473.1 hypothetical protein [Limnochordia bacterium]
MGALFRSVLLAGLLLAVTAAPAAGRELSRAAATVRIVIPAAQQLTIVELVELSSAYPWDKLDRGLPLVVSDVGLMEIQSNADWILTAEALQSEGFRVYARIHNSKADWQPVNALSFWTGPMGSYEFSWDLKIEPAGNPEPGGRTIHLVFTLSHI